MCLWPCQICLSFMRKVFQYRFSEDDGAFAGHPLGISLSLACQKCRARPIMPCSCWANFSIRLGRFILPVTILDPTRSLSRWDRVAGESHIARLIQAWLIMSMWPIPLMIRLNSRRVVQTILESDMIVLGPGSLFTSILPNMVIEEIGQALLETKAEIAYVCNIMTQRGRPNTLQIVTMWKSCIVTLADLLSILSWWISKSASGIHEFQPFWWIIGAGGTWFCWSL